MHVLYAQLDLGLTDVEIGELRQEADANHDGVVDWTEMVTVIEPLLAKFWRAKMAGAPIYEQWVQLHWEAHHTVKEERDTDGKTYMTKGDPFWVNKLSGESTWQKPAVLMEQEAIVARKKARAMQSAPGLEELLAGVFGVADQGDGVVEGSLTIETFWKVVTEGLKMDPALTPAEVKSLRDNTDVNKDGKIDWNGKKKTSPGPTSFQSRSHPDFSHNRPMLSCSLAPRAEFVGALAPKLKSIFGERKDHNHWVAMDTDYYHDGKKYMCE